MRDKLLALYQLQELDTRVLEIQRAADVHPRRMQELEDSLEVMRGELGVLRSEVDGRRKEQRDLEGHISEETNKLRTWRRRLNDIKTPREYQALSRETELGERQVKEFEDSVLAIMKEVEDKQKLIDEKEVDFRERETSVLAEIQSLKAKQAKLKVEADQVRVGRDALTKDLPPALLKKYDKIREARNGLAVALAVDGCCSGCNVSIRAQLLLEMRRLNSIEQCPTCQRMLVPEEVVKTTDVESTGDGVSP